MSRQVQHTTSAARRLMFAWVSVIACLGVFALGERVHTQAGQGSRMWAPRLATVPAGEIQILPVQGNVHMLVGAGGNITVQAGNDGVLMVDTGVANMSAKVIAAMRSISTKPLRYIVNTSAGAEYTGGNAAIADVGETIPFREPNYTAGPQGALDVGRASIISYYTVLHKLSAPTGKASATPEEGWPDNTYSIEQKRLYFNDEPVVIMHRTANSDGNSIVLFRKSDVVSAGAMLDLTQYPIIEVDGGGSIQTMVDAMNGLIDVVVPEANAAGGTKVIPGHGRIADHAEVVYYRDMLAIVRDRIQDMVKRGMTLDQVKAARPTRDWDARYGKDTGAWTTSMFVEAAYKSVAAK
jgi:glyoxylase-like metal-dependent hydrolase (beta-lactamase superfamily II)